MFGIKLAPHTKAKRVNVQTFIETVQKLEENNYLDTTEL